MRFVPNVLRLRASRSAQDERGLSSGGTLLLALVLGVASAFAFEPVGLWPAMFVAFAILCEMTARAPILKRALLIGWGFGVGQFCLGLNWIATAFTFQAAMPAWLGWIAVVLLSLYLAIYPMLATGLAWRFGRDHRLALVLALAGGWAITEWLRATMFTGFAWNPVGVTLIDFGYLDLATVVGTYGLSAIVVILGGALYLLAHRAWEGALLLSIITIAAGLNPSLTLSEGGGQKGRSASSSRTSASRTSGNRAFPRKRRGGSPRSRRCLGASGRASCTGPRQRSPSRSTTPAPASIKLMPSSSGRGRRRWSDPASS